MQAKVLPAVGKQTRHFIFFAVSAPAFFTILRPIPGVSVVAGPGDQYVQRAYQEAQSKVDKAVNDTLTSLFSRTTPATPGELLRILRYPNAEARQVARAAEIYEITLANVKKYVLEGMKLNLEDSKGKFVFFI